MSGPPRRAPVLAVSAAVFRGGELLVAQRGREPGKGLWSLPGGSVEWGEALADAAAREVREETGVDAEIVRLAGHREVRIPDRQGGVERHYVILCFAARWRAGEPKPGPEASEVRWIAPRDLAGLKTTDGLTEMVAAAQRVLASDAG
jgi:ADP-ribose pyrophosphatase YjhB (NUDIX family)